VARNPRIQKLWYTFKNKKFGMRWVTLVNLTNGWLCKVSRGDPASTSELTITRRDGHAGMLEEGEKISADGLYKCRTEPHFEVPERRARRRRQTNGRMPAHEDLPRDARLRNFQRASAQVIVENVNARVKQFACMQKWRGSREAHAVVGAFVFQLVQIKSWFRPVRRRVRPANFAAVFARARAGRARRSQQQSSSSAGSASGSGSDGDTTESDDHRSDGEVAGRVNMARERRAAAQWERARERERAQGVREAKSAAREARLAARRGRVAGL
jgi:hypothetical protein